MNATSVSADEIARLWMMRRFRSCTFSELQEFISQHGVPKPITQVYEEEAVFDYIASFMISKGKYEFPRRHWSKTAESPCEQKDNKKDVFR